MTKSATAVSTGRPEPRPAVVGGPKPAARSRLMRTIWLILFCCLTLFLYIQFTWVSGTELNTNTWSMRQFSFRRDPFTNFQLTGVSYSAPKGWQVWAPAVKSSSLDPAIAVHLRPAPQIRPQWELVVLSTSQVEGDAQLLVDLLAATDENFQPFWPAWSKKHPQKAAILWPAVQHLVQVGLYADLPLLFELALAALPKDDFEQRIKIHIQTSLLQFAQQEVAHNRPQSGLSAAQIGLLYGHHDALQNLVEQIQPLPDQP